MDQMLLNMKINIFFLISNIILPKVLNLLNHVQPETLAVIYWKLYVVLKCYIEKWIVISELYNGTYFSVDRHTCKTNLTHL